MHRVKIYLLFSRSYRQHHVGYFANWSSLCCVAACVSGNKTQQNRVRENAAISHARNSENRAKPEPEMGDHDVTGDAAEKRTKCDWSLNVTWIFQHYNKVKRSRWMTFYFFLNFCR